MADDKIHIRVSINGKSYSADIVPEKEEVYRRAASEINAYITKLKRKSQDYSDVDCLSLAALNFAIDKIDLLRSREVVDEDMTALRNIDLRLDGYLNSPDRTE